MSNVAQAAADVMHVAFDGSLNAHWVTRYALRAALAGGVTRIELLHVRDGGPDAALFARRVEAVRTECAVHGVEVLERELPGHGDVAADILAALPAGDDRLLVCGTRANLHRGGLITGSVAARLLRAGRCQVLAVHVLTPGLLGRSRRLLLPLFGHPGEARGMACWLRLLLPGASELHLLRVMETSHAVIDHAHREVLERLRAHGRAAITDAEHQLHAVLDMAEVRVDTHVRLDRDWMHAGGVVARAHPCDLLLTAASDHQLGAAVHGAPLERLLAAAPCDVGILRGPG